MAWALIAWCVACLLLGFVVLLLSLSVPVPETVWGVRGQQGIIAGATAFVGGLLVLKRPENPVSWLILEIWCWHQLWRQRRRMDIAR